jgi:hypothetical protein
MGYVSPTTIKQLFALSGNRCAFPNCQNRLVDPSSGTLIGDVCHICADSAGGKRYDPQQTEEERQGFSNLILMCKNHHAVVDDDDATYTVAALRAMKEQHEAKATADFVITDDLVTALPNFLLTRSVDQVGRKSETTLCIASLHFKLSTLSGAATDQFEPPSGAPDARHRQWG